MRTQCSPRAKVEGSVFIVALGIAILMTLILSSYLTLVQGQANAVARSQNYNAAIPVAEAGVEEALALLNKFYPNVAASGAAWTNTLTADGWTSLSSSNTTSKSNLVFGSNYYFVTISNGPGAGPVIFSAGVVPFIQNNWGGQMLSNTTLASSVVALVRTLQIQTAANPLLGAALASKGTMAFSGNVAVDSFNSANPGLSTNGQYTPLMKDDKATVATDAAVVSSISGSGSVQIRGYVNTGPRGTIGSSGSFSVGDNSWVSNSTAGIEGSRSNDNFNVTFPDISAPSATFVMSPTSGLISGTNYSLVFRGSQYWGSSNVMYQTSISMSGQQNAIVTNGAVTLYIPNGSAFSFSGQSSIYLAPGSSLTIYCGAASASMSGSTFMGTTNAANLVFYGLPTCTAISFSGGSGFVGTVYAPEATFSASGSSTFTGSLVAKSFSFSGNTTMHYDENLGVAGPSTGYVATSWTEVQTPLAYQELAP